ncbi:hypothetical protein NDU88_000936 [Pleurodeles waltl]|uniref:Uncharacterized protein n=1 Tax=Pleurodeles waltl TaxID=8319 RepID=A0AAV7V6E3_PLEWA|nr:hypothetical protein NDU88_000936 [Pleurodeles waltl]
MDRLRSRVSLTLRMRLSGGCHAWWKALREESGQEEDAEQAPGSPRRHGQEDERRSSFQRSGRGAAPRTVHDAEGTAARLRLPGAPPVTIPGERP